MQYRQGDVLVKEISWKHFQEYQPTLQKVGNSRDQKLVLAEGEATGHAHAIYKKGQNSLPVTTTSYF